MRQRSLYRGVWIPIALCLCWGNVGAVWVGPPADRTVAATSPASDRMPFVGLAVLPDRQIRVTDRNRAEYDFRRANLLDVTQVDHLFLLRNEGSSPLVLTELQPSCHCTSALVERSEGCVPPRADGTLPTLAPGQKVAVRVTVQLPDHTPGPFSKGIFVSVKGHSGPVAYLAASGTLEPSLSIAPDVLEFGALKPNETRSLTLTITYDSRLAPKGEFPPLVSPNQAVAVTPLPEMPVADSAAMRTRTYRITVHSSSSGPIVTNLSFMPSLTKEKTGELSARAITDAFRSLVIPLTGQVTD